MKKSDAYKDDLLSCITSMFKESYKKEVLSTPFGVISISESKYLSLLMAQETKTRMRNLATSNLIRVYPDNTRIGSTNFNPCEFWFHGA